MVHVCYITTIHQLRSIYRAPERHFPQRQRASKPEERNKIHITKQAVQINPVKSCPDIVSIL
ncbi:hypothetical protein CERZMDRAFT_91795, partial [Cercospora zeae-maydis SCOH1-5]